MSKKKQRTAQIFAIFALLGIILSVVGTWLLVLTGWSYDTWYSDGWAEVSQEQIQQIIEAANSWWETPTVTVDWVEVETEVIDNTTSEEPAVSENEEPDNSVEQ